jgi:hypothetical protein
MRLVLVVMVRLGMLQERLVVVAVVVHLEI